VQRDDEIAAISCCLQPVAAGAFLFGPRGAAASSLNLGCARHRSLRLASLRGSAAGQDFANVTPVGSRSSYPGTSLQHLPNKEHVEAFPYFHLIAIPDNFSPLSPLLLADRLSSIFILSKILTVV